MKRDIWNFEPDVVTILVGINDLINELINYNGVEIESGTAQK